MYEETGVKLGRNGGAGDGLFVGKKKSSLCARHAPRQGLQSLHRRSLFVSGTCRSGFQTY